MFSHKGRICSSVKSASTPLSLGHVGFKPRGLDCVGIRKRINPLPTSMEQSIRVATTSFVSSPGKHSLLYGVYRYDIWIKKGPRNVAKVNIAFLLFSAVQASKFGIIHLSQ